MKNITLKQLRAFVAVAREQSFTRAADQLYLTQSTLTSAIKSLEHEIGLQMFDRTTRNVSLTNQGQLFLPIVERMLEDLESSVADLNLIANQELGSVVIAAAGSFISYVLAPATIRLAQRFPNINVRLIDERTPNVISMVSSGEVDFGVTTLFEDEPKLDTVELLTDNFGAVFSPEHPLATIQRPLTWADLRGNALIRLHQSNGIQVLLNRLSELRGLHSGTTTYEVNSVSSLRTFLTSGFGCAVVPVLTARTLMADGLKFSPLHNPSYPRTLSAIKKSGKSLSPSATAIFQFMIDELQKISAGSQIKISLDGERARRFGIHQPVLTL